MSFFGKRRQAKLQRQQERREQQQRDQDEYVFHEVLSGITPILLSDPSQAWAVQRGFARTSALASEIKTTFGDTSEPAERSLFRIYQCEGFEDPASLRN